MGNTVRIRNGMSNATEGDILGNASDIIKDLGVVDLAGGHLLVTEDSPKGMTVQVAGGIVYVPNSNYDELDSDTPKFYPVVCSPEVVTIDNNVSGSTRYDLICVKVDKTIVPDPDADNIATKVVVKGTPGAGIPTTPANHYKLAEIEVVNGETEIENSMITDTRVQSLLNADFITITPSTSTNLTGLLTGNGSNVGYKAAPTGAVVGTTDTQELSAKTLLDVLLKGAINFWVNPNETWEFVSVDDPIGVIRVHADVTTKYYPGMKLKMMNNGNLIYGIIQIVGAYTGGYTSITYLHEMIPGANTALHPISNNPITANYYGVGRPVGFPVEEEKWSIVVSDANDRTFASPTQNVKQNVSQLNLTIPIGSWRGPMCLTLYCSRASLGIVEIKATFSTANNTESDNEKTITDYGRGPLDTAGGRFEVTHTLMRELRINVTAKTPYYLNIWTTQTNIGVFGILGGATYGAKSTIRLLNTYF